jgi:hypothetical protein
LRLVGQYRALVFKLVQQDEEGLGGRSILTLVLRGEGLFERHDAFAQLLAVGAAQLLVQAFGARREGAVLQAFALNDLKF